MRNRSRGMPLLVTVISLTFGSFVVGCGSTTEVVSSATSTVPTGSTAADRARLTAMACTPPEDPRRGGTLRRTSEVEWDEAWSYGDAKALGYADFWSLVTNFKRKRWFQLPPGVLPVGIVGPSTIDNRDDSVAAAVTAPDLPPED